MNYYIINNDILAFENEFDNTLYDYQKLNEEQKAFYELHKCSLQEVLKLELNPIYEPSLEDLKQEKITELNNQYQSVIELGYYDQTENITLAIQEQDRKAFTELLTMIGLAESLGETINEVPIADINSVIQSFPILRLKALLLRYGFYYQTIWATLVSKQNSVKNATTVEELNEVNW